jgi:DNA polymerase
MEEAIAVRWGVFYDCGMKDQRSEQRARLWLRGERAMGLKGVPKPRRRPAVAQALADTEVKPPPIVATTRRMANQAEPKGQFQEMKLPEIDKPFDAEVLSTQEKRRRLLEMDEKEVRGCRRCRLHRYRTQTVFGEGDADARIFFVGEGPGENEDLSGRPFVGRAGQQLERMINGMGLQRQQVYIANIVKCRPPDNRAPAPDEAAICTPYLERQLEIVRPQVIVTLGLSATQYLLQSKQAMGRMRGQWHTWRGIKVMPTYHPAYLLRNYTHETRAAVWSDLKLVMAELGMPVPDRKKEN